MFDPWRGFTEPKLSDEWRAKLKEMASQARGHVLKMTTVAGSGHPGGSMSSMETYLMLYNLANIDPKKPHRDDRDRIIISHGHCSPGAYAGLASAGFFDVTPALHGFRQAGSPFEGHVERSVPGIEWDTGNLGQGLSVGVGKSLYARLSGQSFHTYVMMGDGEQQKGQIAEARRTAVKLKLTSLTAWIDYNRLQISGKTSDVMPQNIKAGWESDGWTVIEVDGHNLDQLYEAFYRARQNDGPPILILASTIMGKGVSFMENDEGYHGAPVKMEMIGKALEELGVDNDIDSLLEKRRQGPPPAFPSHHTEFPKVDQGEPIIYDASAKSDNRGAWGKALVSVAEANIGRDGFVMAVFDCDLAKSVKTDGFANKFPDNFIQMGISEHNTASTAGALSAEKAISVWSDFGVFGVDETYNQARLNDINDANLKLFCTHSGINVGEDGKTHQCIDYFGLLNSTFGWKVITPADPNQTDRIVRYVLSQPGNFAVIMGRAVIATITDEHGKPFFGKSYRYRYGRMETIRNGEDLVLVSSGNMLPNCFDAWQILESKELRVQLVSVSDWSDLHADDLKMLAEFPEIVVVEDHNIKTGLGAAISATMFEGGLSSRLTRKGVTAYASSGKAGDLYKMLGLDAESISTDIESILQGIGAKV